MSQTDPAATGGAPQKGFKRWLWTLLIVSVAVNLLVIGALAGAFWHRGHRGHGAWEDHRQTFGIVRFARSLPADRRDVLEGIVKGSRSAFRDQRKQARAARRAARDLLAAEPFDAEAFSSAVNDVVVARSTSHKFAADLLTQAVGAMTAEERKAYAQWQHERRGKRHR